MKKLFALLALTLASLSFAQADEVTEVAVDDGIAKKWEFKFDGAYQGGFTGHDNTYFTIGDDAAVFDLGVGYNFTSNWFLGVNSGYFYHAGHQDSKADNYIPLLADVVYRWNIGKTNKWSIFAEGRAGYLFSTRSDQQWGNQEYELPNSGYFEVMPGLYYRVKPNIDLRFSVGYAYYNTADDEPLDLTHNQNTITVKLGMNFRSAPKMEVRSTPIEEPVATPEPEPVVVTPEPEPVKIVETTTEEQKKLGEREVVIFYIIRKHNILPEKDALLQEMAEFTKTHKTSKIIVKSYADKGTGNYKLNQMYSRNRMNEVVKHLVEQYGISRDQIEASYYGDTVQPYEENDLNRCSIIVVKEIE